MSATTMHGSRRPWQPAVAAQSRPAPPTRACQQRGIPAWSHESVMSLELERGWLQRWRHLRRCLPRIRCAAQRPSSLCRALFSVESIFRVDILDVELQPRFGRLLIVIPICGWLSRFLIRAPVTNGKHTARSVCYHACSTQAFLRLMKSLNRHYTRSSSVSLSTESRSVPLHSGSRLIDCKRGPVGAFTSRLSRASATAMTSWWYTEI
mmetsp:Transcript_119153/g.222754  ORF Transcript_119153/g.222754 Transcript_119153/m.222754 type:complete len:208 (+) Transcript_119153:578-1201(+)